MTPNKDHSSHFAAKFLRILVQRFSCNIQVYIIVPLIPMYNVHRNITKFKILLFYLLQTLFFFSSNWLHFSRNNSPFTPFFPVNAYHPFHLIFDIKSVHKAIEYRLTPYHFYLIKLLNFVHSPLFHLLHISHKLPGYL